MPPVFLLLIGEPIILILQWLLATQCRVPPFPVAKHLNVLPKCAPMDVPSSFMVFRPASQKNMNAIALHQTGLRYSKLYFVPEFA